MLPETRVVLVDDHRIIRQCVRLLLSRTPHTTVVGEADNGQSAVNLVQTLKPDLVIMDVMLPELNGIEATRQILKSQPNVKVIALSSNFHDIFVRNMFNAGACAYVLKDSLYNELPLAVENAMKDSVFIS